MGVKSTVSALSKLLPGAAVAGAALAPEEAEAGPLLAGAKRILDPRFLNGLGGSNPRVGLKGAVEGMETGVSPRVMDKGGEFSLHDFEGSPYILTQSDRSAAGGDVTSVHSTPIDPVSLRGGRDFMFDSPSEGQVWASDPGVVKSLLTRAKKLEKEHGGETLILPYSMAPTGIDFATMPLDVMIGFAREKMSKANTKKLDGAIKKLIPQWGGVKNPDSVKAFRDVKGPVRKKIADLMDKNFRDVRGGMSISEARAATTDVEQYLSPEGQITNIGRIDTTKAALSDSGHPTYHGGLPGEGVGTFKSPHDVRPFMAQNGRALTGDAADIRALSMNHGLSQGVITPELLKSIYGGAAGAAVLGGSLASEDADAGVITRGGKQLIEAYHGSPHTFDKFSMDNIGTGEGAQAYGHGLYFADSEDVAKGYRDGLQYKAFDIGGEAEARGIPLNAGGRAEVFRQVNANPNATPQEIAKKVGYANAASRDIPVDELASFIGDYQAANKGSLYRTELDVDPDTLLDWDKPLSETEGALPQVLSSLGITPDDALKATQDFEALSGRLLETPSGTAEYEALQSAWNNALNDPVQKIGGIIEKLRKPVGTFGYDAASKQTGGVLVDALGKHDGASEMLRNSGIPGIRYLDGDSRSAGQGSSNYVMFDDKNISITERGFADPALLAATAAATATAAAGAEFGSRRANKSGHWKQSRDDVMEMVSGAGNAAMYALDRPLQGWLGITAVAGSLASGNSMQDALTQGANIAQQPPEQTTYDMGGSAVDAMAQTPFAPAAPLVGAAIHAGTLMGSPI
jgi:hypothetical protein